MGVHVDTEITEIIEMCGCFLHDVCLVGCFLGRMNSGTHEGCPYGVCMF